MESLWHFKRSQPEAEGVLTGGIDAFVSAIEQLASQGTDQELHSFMLLRHGHVIAEGWWHPYGPQVPHMLFSLSKSFTSTAVGFAVEEGVLSVEDPVISFFPKESPRKINDHLAAMQIRHLLSMSTGHTEDTTGYMIRSKTGNWVRAFLRRPVQKQPGTHFLYNTGATSMLSAILQKVTGQTLLDYLTPRLFKPLGIEGAEWESCPMGIHTGGFGLSVKTEDIAKFGQLYLQQGVWQGRKILSEEWIKEATQLQIHNGENPDSDWAQGYGYQFWRCRHDAYRGDGAFGQFCLVMPHQDMVMAATGGLKDMQAILNLVYRHILPAVQERPLPVAAEWQALDARLKTLGYEPQKGQHTSDIRNVIQDRPYRMQENRFGIDTTAFQFDSDVCQIHLNGTDGQNVIVCGLGNWQESTVLKQGKRVRVYASGAWTGKNTLTVQMRYIETPFCDLVSYRFEGSKLSVRSKINVSFSNTRAVVITGLSAFSV